MSRSIPFAALACTALGCLAVLACGKDTPTSPVTSEDILGTWYTKQVDAATGMTVSMFLDCRSDGTVRVGLMNGSSQVELMNVGYAVAGGVFTFTPPAADTASRNTFQIMFADQMNGIVGADRAYMQGGNLVFAEPGRSYSFSSTMPSVSGRRITGTVAVVNGSFGRGGVVVADVELNTNRVAGAFLDDVGPYTLWGLASGQWYVMAIYIPKSHALDWTSYDISAFPVDMTAIPVTVASGGTVANTDLTLDLGTGQPNAMVVYRNNVSRAPQTLARR